MIPKIAHIHWDGQPMNWLRIVTIATFAKFNPDWEIRLIRSDPSLTRSDLAYSQKADMTWWLALQKHGGFLVGSDIVFLKPIPEEWLDADLTACTNDTGQVFQFAMLGATPNHPFFDHVIKEGNRRITTWPTLDFQVLGVLLLQNQSRYMWDYGTFKELPMSSLCHYDHNTCEKLWDEEHTIQLPDNAIGVHWYGGHVTSAKHEWGTRPGQSFPIVKLAETVFP